MRRRLGAGAVCYPFVCMDYCGRSSLRFSGDSPEAPVKRADAVAFWGVFLIDSDDLDDFEERVYHPGASLWLDHGCDSGRSLRRAPGIGLGDRQPVRPRPSVASPGRAIRSSWLA